MPVVLDFPVPVADEEDEVEEGMARAIIRNFRGREMWYRHTDCDRCRGKAGSGVDTNSSGFGGTRALFCNVSVHL